MPRRDRRTGRSAGSQLSSRLRRLRDSGERIRFHGFTLGDSERDRTIAVLMDEYEGNLAEVVKRLLYALAANAETFTLPDMTPLIERMESAAYGDLTDDLHQRIEDLIHTIQNMAIAAPADTVRNELNGTADQLDRTRQKLFNFKTK